MSDGTYFLLGCALIYYGLCLVGRTLEGIANILNDIDDQMRRRGP